jgi:hypothetical protein
VKGGDVKLQVVAVVPGAPKVESSGAPEISLDGFISRVIVKGILSPPHCRPSGLIERHERFACHC